MACPSFSRQVMTAPRMVSNREVFHIQAGLFSETSEDKCSTTLLMRLRKANRFISQRTCPWTMVCKRRASLLMVLMAAPM